jgi:hypothetical protein
MDTPPYPHKRKKDVLSWVHIEPPLDAYEKIYSTKTVYRSPFLAWANTPFLSYHCGAMTRGLQS